VRTEPATSAASELPARAPNAWARRATYAIGVVLLGAAIAVVYRQHGEFATALAAAKSAPAWKFGAILLLPLVNWALTSVLLWTLMRPFGRVGRWEMAALVGSAWLGNMLPGKPGFIGRVAYHKAVNGIPVRSSLLATMTALLTGGLGIVIALAVQLVADPALRRDVPLNRLVPVVLAISGAALLPAAVLALRGRKAGLPVFETGWVLAAAVTIRLCETYVWALRYWLAFSLIGQGQSYGVCVIVAGVSQIAGILPVPLGLREWSVGVAASVVRPGAAVPGLTVDLVTRAAEVAVAIPVGVVGYVWICRRMARARA
jgi:hypothetical protein